MEIKIIRSEKRKKTIGARVVGNTMFVNAPVDISDERLKKIIEIFKKRFEKRQLKKELNRNVNLKDVCDKLNAKYFDGKIDVKSIEYSPNQSRLFGTCNHKLKTIKISYRLAEMPEWVRDYVIIHEMAHIIEPNHSPAFWNLVLRYELAERARGYLLAKGFESEEETDYED